MNKSSKEKNFLKKIERIEQLERKENNKKKMDETEEKFLDLFKNTVILKIKNQDNNKEYEKLLEKIKYDINKGGSESDFAMLIQYLIAILDIYKKNNYMKEDINEDIILKAINNTINKDKEIYKEKYIVPLNRHDFDVNISIYNILGRQPRFARKKI
tara:strand:- start:3862 stop:4332 length:471 start_codon:yes stop_codon:yes gene_type:complete